LDYSTVITIHAKLQLLGKTLIHVIIRSLDGGLRRKLGDRLAGIVVQYNQLIEILLWLLGRASRFIIAVLNVVISEYVLSFRLWHSRRWSVIVLVWTHA
jgi:hypothetical protein